MCNPASSFEPAEESVDVSSLLLTRHLLTQGWVDEARAAPLIQLPVEEARGSILKLARALIGGQALLTTIDGIPDGTPPVWRLSPSALNTLLTRDSAVGHTRKFPTRIEIAKSFAKARGRISSTELRSLVNASGTNVGSTLKALAADGVLTPSTPTGRGRGFYYRWTGADEAR